MSSLFLYKLEKIDARTGETLISIRNLNHGEIMELLEGYTSTGSAPRWIFTKPGGRYRYIITAY